MRINCKYKILILLSIILIVFNSCVMDYKRSFHSIRNCSNDTLLICLTDSDSLEDWMFWGKNSEDTVGPLFTAYHVELSIHGKKELLNTLFCALPDSKPEAVFSIKKDTCYIYAIKWQVATRYSMDEIRARKLYDRRTVTKKDFTNCVFEYRTADSH